MKKIKIMLAFGTRPEAIKMCPLVLELRKRAEIETRVVVTGQHREMLQQVLDAFSIVPNQNLHIMKERQDLTDITVRVLEGFKDILKAERPDLLLVHGDTSTSFSAALAAFYAQVPIGHIEAGLRTYNLQSPYPEEFNRQGISTMANYHFAPTEKAKQNLLEEKHNPASIIVTGNTAIDALQTTVKKNYTHLLLDWAGNHPLILITAHRRENLGEPMRQMFRAIRRIINEHPDLKALYPIHKNPLVREIADEVFEKEDRIRLVEPLDVLDFHNIMARSYLILTDSGGIQEEAPSLGKPVLVMRDTTERPEGISAGTLVLTGTSEETIYSKFKELITDSRIYNQMAVAQNPYGDGHASERIANFIIEEIYRHGQ